MTVYELQLKDSEDICKVINDRIRSLGYYHAVTKQKRITNKSYKKRLNKKSNDYHYNVTREKNKKRFLEGNG